MRYALKDAIYELFLDTLDELLSHVALDVYLPGGVGYVEFSVSFNDLVLRPWVFKHLYMGAKRAREGHLRSHRHQLLQMRFLAGFGRGESPKLSDLRSQQPLLSDDQLVAVALDEAHFSQALAKLGQLRAAVSNPSDPSARALMEVVVVWIIWLTSAIDHSVPSVCRPSPISYASAAKTTMRASECAFTAASWQWTLARHEHVLHMAVSAAVISRVLEVLPSRCSAQPARCALVMV